MSDLLQEGLDWLEGQRREHLSHEVTYRRGAAEATVPATVAATRFEVDDGTGMILEQETRDYLIATADLVLEGRNVLPERGDEIVDGAEVYEAMDLGPERHYRFCDPDRTTLRIHTKLVGTEGA
ncbi:MAG: hypothetical protein R6X33_14725 [Candidatus Brocadiia bacterium]